MIYVFKFARYRADHFISNNQLWLGFSADLFSFLVRTFPDDWADSSSTEVQGIKEAVSGVLASMEQFCQHQQSKTEVRRCMSVCLTVRS